MTVGGDVLVVLAVVAALALAITGLWRRAVRIDRSHLAVLAARRTMEAQLDRRAAATAALVATGALDPSAAVLLADVARRSQDAADQAVVADGLDGPAAGGAPGGPAGLPGGAADVPGGPDDPAGPERAEPRALVESEFSRALRTVLDDEVRADLAADPRSRHALADLDAAWYRLEVARRFHDTRVVQARQARAGWLPRAFRLAGRAPLPRTADMDTDHVEGAGA